ncbi:hypothetical protein L2E82_02682 [Cichorium intybus]|uniref:Uncharacterized protein n=1 Tax=Cichorium intybus TaxID=13427 RepID=A0ACB9H213_CICIN|nr:hypothetical protein L2E82_02682 [Cichorium intybus]
MGVSLFIFTTIVCNTLLSNTVTIIVILFFFLLLYMQLYEMTLDTRPEIYLTNLSAIDLTSYTFSFTQPGPNCDD